MLTVSKCLTCGRGFTAHVAKCQICGGGCVPIEPNDAAVVLPRPEAESGPAQMPKAVCPCCDGEPGPYFIEQTTRRLIDVSLVPSKRTYRVTAVKVPGVCNSCHRLIEKKRFIADVLTPLPLLVSFVVLVIADKPVFVAPVVLYLIYLATSLTYSWADFLLYGGDLSWKLVSYVPEGGKESSPRYYSGWLHGVLRVGFVPVLALLVVALIFVAAQIQVFLKRTNSSPQSPSTVAAAPPVDKPFAQPRPAQPNYTPSTIAPAKTPVEEALRIFKMTPLFAVPVDSDTLSDPKLGHPATSPMPRRKKLLSVVTLYYDESKVPPATPYQMMNGPTALANFALVKSDGLIVGDGQIFLTPVEVAELGAKISGAIASPSPIRLNTAH